MPDDIGELKKIIASRDHIIKLKEEELAKERCERERKEFELDELQKKYREAEKRYEETEKKYQDIESKYEDIESKYEEIEKKYKYLQKLFFGRKSEKLKLTPEEEIQARLFDEAEGNSEEDKSSIETEESGAEEDDDITIVKQHTRKRPGRKPIPDDLPTEDVIHDIPEEEKKCPCCGKERPVIGKEESKELNIIAPKVVVLNHIRLKYGPCPCDEFLHTGKSEVICGPAPVRMLPGSIAGDGLLAYVLTSKFCDALPFYRLSRMFERIDVDISRATMCNWTISAFEKMSILFEVLTETLKSGEFIRMDETTVQVLHEEGRSPESKSYMWVAIGYPARGKPLVLYEYHPSRSGEIPMKFLEGFNGYIQTDGYKAYNRSADAYGLIHVGCFAHARREFFKAYDPKSKNKRPYKALMYIRKIYEIESDLRGKNLPDADFVERRKNLVNPVLEEFYVFLIETKEIVTPSSHLGGAVTYTLNVWDKLIRYLDRAYLTPDNNEIERSIKAFVIGRKNWLFSNTPRGARASAGIYSLIESAKLNSLDPYKYLLYLFTRFPNIRNDRDELLKLLPSSLSIKDISIHE